MGFSKLEDILLLTLPLLVSFDYVLLQRMLSEDQSFDIQIAITIVKEQFYFLLLTSIFVQVFWLLNIVLTVLKMNSNIKRIFLALQVIMVYGLAVDFSKLLSLNIQLLDLAPTYAPFQFYISWCSVCLSCLWVIFIVFLAILINQLYLQSERKTLDVQQELNRTSRREQYSLGA